ncbi:translocator protein-like [Bradysia coprophila]|uniref:translocator protein-like n=1 Tax=Bradysia coprophila TaxID=38358 RepID=UPI00187D9D82|nr:translocator protein-like [Bradysia coprophila]
MDGHCDKLKLAAAIIIPNIGSFVQKHYVEGLKVPGGPCWYTNLKKPWYTPPNYVFPPMWLAMYTSMGYASYLVWRDGNGFNDRTACAFLWYGSHLISQVVWSPIFFKHHSMKWSFIDISISTAAAIGTAVTFYNINETAGKILIPHLVWMGFLTFWNYVTYKKNTGGSDKEIKEN